MEKEMKVSIIQVDGRIRSVGTQPSRELGLVGMVRRGWEKNRPPWGNIDFSASYSVITHSYQQWLDLTTALSVT